jgi:hypothetical protein
MNKETIASLLKEKEVEIFDLYNTQGNSFWISGPQGKWTAGQHAIHLVQVAEALLKGINLPMFVLSWRFGKCNRMTKSYDEVVQRYKEKLFAAGPVVAPISVNMPISPIEEETLWLDKLSNLNTKLNKRMKKLSDHHMDTLLLPHPLMGKMTLREILMWHAYHIQHHKEVLEKMYVSEAI